VTDPALHVGALAARVTESDADASEFVASLCRRPATSAASASGGIAHFSVEYSLPASTGIPHVSNKCSLPANLLPHPRRRGFCVRPRRYALASASGSVAAGVLGLRECDNPVFVKIADAAAPRRHVVSGSQGDNMERMARMGRGGGRHALRRFDRRAVRRERSVAVRDAVGIGWDSAAVHAALIGASRRCGDDSCVVGGAAGAREPAVAGRCVSQSGARCRSGQLGPPGGAVRRCARSAQRFMQRSAAR
jgi:hypothetical protein